MKYLLFIYLLPATVLANDAFAKAESKAQEILDFLTGTIVTTLLAIAIVVAGLFLAKGRGNPQLMWGIIIGSILIGSSVNLASWLLS